MLFVLMLLSAYGLTFGLMNGKAWFLTDRLKAIQFRVLEVDEIKTTFFERMLLCPYCTGFHSGWISWLLLRLPVHLENSLSVGAVVTAVMEAVASAFASSVVSYLLDTLAQWLEDSNPANQSAQE